MRRPRKKAKKQLSDSEESDLQMSDVPRINSRNGRQLPNYNEEQMTMQFSESEDAEDEDGAPAAARKSRLTRTCLALTQVCIAVEDGDSIDGVFDHKRDPETGRCIFIVSKEMN